MPSHRADTPALRRPRRPAAPPATRRPRRAPQRSAGQLSAPQVGIAGALGLATIAAPISGAMASPAPKAQVNPISAVSLAPAPAFPARAVAPAIGVEAVRVIPADARTASAPKILAARPIIVSRASRSGERPVLPGCEGVARVTEAPNGQLPASSLCTLWNGDDALRADAAVALAKLNIAYKERFGDDLCLTDSYRTLASQRRLKSVKPGLAATPGTSQHGWGLAVDLCDGIESGSGSRYQWMRSNAPSYGWDNPTWARIGGSGPDEPWHWQFADAE